MPMTKNTATAAMKPASLPFVHSAAAIGTANSVPNVPGAPGTRPVPNPNAMKCAGCCMRKPNVGLTAFKVRDGNVIVCMGKAFDGAAVPVAHDEAWGCDNLADAR